MCEDYLTGISSHSNDILLTPIFQTLFQEKVGSILYLASQTRPDNYILQLNFLAVAIKRLRVIWLLLIDFFVILRRLLY